MAKSTRISLIGLAALVVLLTATFHLVDRRLAPIPGFYLWKAVSWTPRSHGRAAIDDVVIYYETYGERRAGAVSAGVARGTGFVESMHYQIRALAPTRLRRCARQPWSRALDRWQGPLHYQRMADDMLALLDVLDVRRWTSSAGAMAESSV
jgi:hypothetical protein